MTQFVLASPSHANGGCIFANPGTIDVIPGGECASVFASPRHPNGGCIFADPNEIFDEVRRGGGGSLGRMPYDHRARLLQEDDEILAVIMAYMSTKH